MANGIMGVPAVVIWAGLANPTFRVSDTDTRKDSCGHGMMNAISSATISFLWHWPPEGSIVVRILQRTQLKGEQTYHYRMTTNPIVDVSMG